METNILATAVALSDQDLLARIDALAGTEREATAELVAHLAALELRPSLYAALGFGSLFSYCTQALRLSEDAACRRIEVARTCRRFPVILDLLASGAVSLTSVRMVSPHLTAENHEAVLARARNRSRKEIEALVAELAPQPDVPASVRRLPVPKVALPRPALALSGMAAPSSTDSLTVTNDGPADAESSLAEAVAAPTVRPTPRPIIRASAPERYRVQFTIGRDTHDKLRGMQALLRREIPTGDPGAIFDLALDALREKVEKAKFGNPSRRYHDARANGSTYGLRIRSSADRRFSRHIPNAVKRAVWSRDDGQCAFVASTGRRCSERNFLEFHHIQPYALDGAATVGNISLRCRRHNAYEAELVFAPRGTPTVREAQAGYERGPDTARPVA